MAKPKPRWLKLDQASKVSVKVGSTHVEIKILMPAKRIREQLKMLAPKQ